MHPTISRGGLNCGSVKDANAKFLAERRDGAGECAFTTIWNAPPI